MSPSGLPAAARAPTVPPWWCRWRTALLAAFLLVALAVAGAEFARGLVTYRRAERAVTARHSETAAVLAGATDLFVARRVAIATTLATAIFEGPQPLARPARRALLASVRRVHPEVNVVAVIDARGRYVEADPEAAVGLEVGDRLWFARLVSGAPYVASDLVTGRLSGQPALPVAAAARSEDGRLLGAVMVGLRAASLKGILERPLAGGAAALLIDRTGRVVLHGAHPDLGWPERDFSDVGPVADALLGLPVEGARYTSPITGEQVLATLVRVPALGWVVGVEQRADAALAVARRDLELSAAYALAILVVGAAAALGLGAWLTRPLTALADAAAAVARGDLAHRVGPRGFGELRWLSETFDDMAVRLQANVARLETAERRAAFLAEASNRLSLSLEAEATLASLARLAVPALADYCVVDLAASDGSVRRVAVVHRDPGSAGLAAALRRYSAERGSHGLAARVIATGRGLLMADVDDAHLASVARDTEHLRILRALGPRSQVTAPLVARDHAFGAISLLASTSGRRYGPEDLALVEDLARRAALALDNARLIEEAREAQASLRRQLDLTNAITGSVAEGLFALDRDARIAFANPAAAEIFGSTAADLRGRPVSSLVQPGEPTSALVAAIEARATARVEAEFVRRDGRPVTVDATVSPIAGEGAAGGTVLAFRDVTERLALEQQLRQSQKMEAIGRLAGGIAHDFNNILTVIGGYSELLADGLPEGSAAREQAGEIHRAASRASALTRQLLAFSRKQLRQPRVLDVNAVVASMDLMLRRLIGEHIRLETRLGRVPGRVEVDPAQLEQVILNLAVNARDAMPDGGTLAIATAEVDLPPRGEPGAARPAGRCIRLAVTDTGFGMDAATQGRLFEPFFTTKPRGEGTGLGLATVYGIVQQSGGCIEVDSVPGRGSTFAVYLPRVEKPEEVESAAAPEPPPAPATGTVLVVEDEDMVRSLACRVLERAGYTVHQARSGPDALAASERIDGGIDLLLADIVMPAMSGPEIARRLSARRPETRVLFMSGYTDDALGKEGVLDPATAFLQKPFTPDALLCKVRDVLASRPAGRCSRLPSHQAPNGTS